MKKIFAIAMAAVMALTMTSAFAAFNWTNPVINRTGKATVEVIPYAKVSDGAGGFVWKRSPSAKAVSSENVYFAVKLTVAPNPDPKWLEHASVALEAMGLSEEWANSDYSEIPRTDVDANSSAQAVYYLTRDSAESNALSSTPWTKLTKSFTLADNVEARDSLCIFAVPVVNSNKAQVCATLTSSFGTGGDDFTEGVVGEYYVVFEEGSLSVYADEAAAADREAFLVRYTVNPSTEKVSSVTNRAGSSAPYDYASIKKFFGIDVGTKVTKQLVNANFGWADEVQSCHKWNKTSVPAPEDVPSLPKTGDASVIGYAAMAVLAACGLLKRR